VPVKRAGPVQPIFFSHVIHAGASRSTASIATRRAALERGGAALGGALHGCHKIVAATGNPEVQKLHGLLERKESIPWVRVFKVPEHAKFVHKNHIRRLAVQTCHAGSRRWEQVGAP
jgi:hypothetical protein